MLRRSALFLLAIPALTAGCRSSEGAPPEEDDDGGCLYVEDARWGPDGEVPVRVEVVADGLEVPWGIAFLPDGDLLVTERPGRIRRVDADRPGDGTTGTLLDEPVAEVEALARSEGGLLGIALHPDFSDNRLFYLYYTAGTSSDSVNRVKRWRLDGDGRGASPDRVIVDGIPAARFHDGGRLRVGPDRMLYAGTGDATDPSSAQDTDSLAGKLLRVSLDGNIPEDNPWPGKAAYVQGIRNTQGFDWRGDGALVGADHGPTSDLGRSDHDEVSVVAPGDNLGLPEIYRCQVAEGMITPAITFARAVPPGGAAFYTGDEISSWKGSLLLGALGARHLHRGSSTPTTHPASPATRSTSGASTGGCATWSWARTVTST